VTVAESIRPEPVDEVTITILVDNVFDVLMSGKGPVERWPLPADVFRRDLPVAEHGFAALLEVARGGRRLRVLFDAGVSRTGVLHNLDALGAELGDVQTIVLSHGHADHANGLEGVVRRLGRQSLPLVLHPDAALERKLVLPSGFEVGLPAPALADLAREGVEVVESARPSLLIEGSVLVSGEVPRTTGFETGLPTHWAERNGVWEADPQILDDQCAILRLRDRGLVVLTGCSHAGIVNTVRQAIALTGEPRVHAVVGGFHLSSALFEPRIPDTVAALKATGPDLLVPGHCTGFAAQRALAEAMPDAFVPSGVGTTIRLRAASG
jgi:7,8-dihydropterin-6-yl-methyl-4-(beta-D-ribofuranosyl)aminobenzene 5'-phosphate synthase